MIIYKIRKFSSEINQVRKNETTNLKEWQKLYREQDTE